MEQGRWQKAVEAWASGAYTIAVTRQSEQEIRGCVANRGGREYRIVLSAGQSGCGCKDSLYRKTACKHALALALHVMRPLQPLPQAGAD